MSWRNKAERTTSWRHHVCPPQSRHRDRGVSERMANLLRIDFISTYRPPTSRGDAPPSEPPSLYNVAWGPSWLISAQRRQFLTVKAGMHVREQLSASLEMVTCVNASVPKWSCVTWHPTVECAIHVNHIWPLQAWAFNANTTHRLMWCGNTLIDTSHHAQGVDARAPLQPAPQSDLLPDRIVISAKEVNPDADIAPFDATQLVMDTSGHTVGCYDAAGHLAGRVTLPRLYYLERRWHARQEAPNTSIGQCATLPDAVLAAMTARGVHRAPARTTQRPLRRWQPSTPVWVAIRDSFQLQKNWSSSPFSICSPLCATAHPSDAAFGAVHDAYAFKWTVSGLFNPPNSSADAIKAMRWAIQSTMESSPVLNVGLIPERRNMKGVNRLRVSTSQLCLSSSCLLC